MPPLTFTDPVGRLLEMIARFFAIVGGIVLTGLTLMSVYSVFMRNLVGAPIIGDFELVQMGCAIAIASFLPFTQLRGGNIMIDFFTARASVRTRAALDTIGALLLGLALGLLAWRTGLGGLSVWRNDETTMIMAVPVWWGYGMMTPPMAVASLAAFYSAWRHTRYSVPTTRPASESQQ
jgi:TRAP-type C4-dicarboxylate transport system permease small subunit